MTLPKKQKRMQHKPTQKVVNFSYRDNSLRAHDLALVPYRIWHEFRAEKTLPNYATIDVSYRPVLKVIQTSNKEYTFFDSFYHVNSILISEGITEQPCLVYQGSAVDIELVAWKDVFDLAFQRYINHASFYQRLHKALESIPRNATVLRTFMKSQILTIDTYCDFAGINRSTYNYDNSVTARLKADMQKKYEKKRLPTTEDWLNE